jgi:hypothetical protein
MTLLEPPVNPMNLNRDDDLDHLLATFFRREVPHPWPVLKPPAPVPAADGQAAARPLSRSRLALAASVALLVVGQGLLNRAYHKDEPPAAGDVDVASKSAPKGKATPHSPSVGPGKAGRVAPRP